MHDASILVIFSLTDYITHINDLEHSILDKNKEIYIDVDRNLEVTNSNL